MVQVAVARNEGGLYAKLIQARYLMTDVPDPTCTKDAWSDPGSVAYQIAGSDNLPGYNLNAINFVVDSSAPKTTPSTPTTASTTPTPSTPTTPSTTPTTPSTPAPTTPAPRKPPPAP